MRAALAACLLALAACSEAPAGSPEEEFARALAAAKDEARASLPFYWQHFNEPAGDEYDFWLKAALPRRDGQPGAEEAWLENIARAPDKIVGELAEQPNYLGDLKRGDMVEIQEGQVVDWAFKQGQSLLGHYTTRVMLPRLESTQQDILRAMLTPDPKGEVE
jgi:uncharacterized protein YegJ (DUF2314 family)